MPTKTVVYISGPMSGIKDWNFPAFDQAACLLRSLGYRVINPADFGSDPRFTWADSIGRDLSIMPCVKLVCLLPGWEDSEGSRLERVVAHAMGIDVLALCEILEIARSARRPRGSATQDFAPSG